MKRELLALVTLTTLVASQVTAGVAEAGGSYKRHGRDYSGGHNKSYTHYRGHGYKDKHRGYGYGYRRGGRDYDYLIGGLILGATATYLFSQPRYVERQTVVYQTAPTPFVPVNPTVGSVLEYNRTGQPTTWQDPDTGHTVTTAPVRTHMTSAGPCREYITSVIIGGQEQQAYGTACRQNDGSWRLQR
ncbi:MAG: RT0821/Lpp0805 family surface protein [Gammaproteobacteria bacterium]|nr:RT0821/Lpp0805 family surface protein [Gammaproteobacteria bacterium]